MDKTYVRDDAILQSREILKGRFVIIDTETTGLKEPEIVQFASLTSDNKAFSTFVKPTVPIDPGATEVHHITDAMVAEALPFRDYWFTVKYFLESNIRIVGYNVQYDLKAIRTSLDRNNCADPLPYLEVFDVMPCYAAFEGTINPKYGTFQWHKLEEAIQACNLTYNGGAHDASHDCIATWNLLQFIANQSTTWEVAIDELLAEVGAECGVPTSILETVAKITYRKGAG